MKQLILSSLFCFYILHGFCQVSNHVTSNTQNKAWFMWNGALPLHEKLQNVKERLVLDTTVVVTPPVYISLCAMGRSRPSPIEKKDPDDSILSAKPVFLITHPKIPYLLINSTKLSGKELTDLLMLLNEEQLTAVNFLTGSSAGALFGRVALGGVIIINIKAKRYFDKFKKWFINTGQSSEK